MLFFSYWETPFDPLRERVLTDEKLFKIDTAESENEQDISLSKVKPLCHCFTMLKVFIDEMFPFTEGSSCTYRLLGNKKDYAFC